MVQPVGNLFIIAAPSGAGKSSLINALLESVENKGLQNPATLSVSHTTRPPRDGEINGVHYYFTDHEHFENMINEDGFYEYAKVFEQYYGTSKPQIGQKLSQGIDVFLDIDWQGARQVREKQPETVSIFILPPSLDVLKRRLVARGKDNANVIEHRMAKAMNEMSHANEFDYVLINDDFDKTLDQLASIVKTTSLLRENQKRRHSNLFSSLVN